MNTQSNAVPESPLNPQAAASAAMLETRPLYWSVRRELWENRSIYIAPLATAAVYLFGYLISLFWVPYSMRAMGTSHSAPQLILLAMPYAHAGMLTTAIAFIVGIFYSLDALYGERRDRSILFWKSLPVSDLTTVLSKAIIPLVVLPLFVFAITVALQFIMRLVSMADVLISGGSAAAIWRQLPLFEMQVVLLYGLIVLRALARTHLCLADSRLGLRAPRALFMGCITPDRDRCFRKNCLQHCTFWIAHARSAFWILCGCFRSH